MTRFLFFIILACATGCFPKRHIPEVYDLPDEALNHNLESALSDETFIPGNWPNTNWWLMFNDCQLDNLMQKALKDNPDIKIAQARIALSYHDAGATGSALFPNLGLESDITRFRISKTGAISGFANSLAINPALAAAPIGPPGFTFTQEEINLNGNYQIDFWQKNLNNFKAAISEVLAQEADTAFTTVMISTQLVKRYFYLQTLYERKNIAVKRQENRKEYAKLIEKRIANDIDNKLNLKRAQSRLLEIEVNLNDIEEQITITKNQISALVLGSFNEIIDPVEVDSHTLVPFELPSDLPVNLIAHRPDVTAAAWRVEEAARVIKVAKAAYYPNFNISYLFGFQTIHPKEFFKWNSIYGQAGPAVNLPLFEGGLLYANLGAAYEEFNIAVEEYNKILINAVQDVLNSLTQLKTAIEELNQLKEIAHLSKENYELVQKRHKNQIDSYLTVLDASLDYLTKEDQQYAMTATYYQNLTQLISALGGGYDDCQ